MTAVRHVANLVQLSSKPATLQPAAALVQSDLLPLLWLKCIAYASLQAGRRETALFVEFQAIVKGLLAGMYSSHHA